MEIILRLEEFTLKKTNENWFENTDDLNSIFKLIEKTEWGYRLKYFYRFQDDEIRTFETFNTLKNVITKCKHDTYVMQESDTETNSLGMYLEVNEFGFSVILFKNIDRIELIKPIVQSMIDFTINLYSHLQSRFLFGYRLGIELYEIKKYVVNLDKINDFWECNKIVDFLSLNYHKISEMGRPKDYYLFSRFIFPSSVKKMKNRDLLILNWNDEMNNEEEISNSMKYRDEWIYENLDDGNV